MEAAPALSIEIGRTLEFAAIEERIADDAVCPAKYCRVAEIADIRLQYDFYYIRNIFIWLGLVIIMKMLTGFGHKQPPPPPL